MLRLERVDSTNTHARRLLESDPAHGPLVIVAAEQTEGRGRLGRAWASPRGGLWCTLLMPLAREAGADPGDLGARLGEACLQAVRQVLAPSGVDPSRARLKPPNDILVQTPEGERKVLGILTEIVGAKSQRHLIVGVGVNARVDEADLPAELRAIAGSLSRIAGRDIEPREVLGALLPTLLEAIGPVAGETR